MNVGLDSSVIVASVKSFGEKYHAAAVELAAIMKKSGHRGICSALVALEVPGALLSSTSMPIERVYDVQLSTVSAFNAATMAYEPYLARTMELMIEFRELKSKRGIGSADFHHLATSVEEGCSMFVTTDEKHLLRKETRDQLSKELEITDPSSAARKVLAK